MGYAQIPGTPVPQMIPRTPLPAAAAATGGGMLSQPPAIPRTPLPSQSQAQAADGRVGQTAESIVAPWNCTAMGTSSGNRAASRALAAPVDRLPAQLGPSLASLASLLPPPAAKKARVDVHDKQL